jgi:hypothetical protein
MVSASHAPHYRAHRHPRYSTPSDFPPSAVHAWILCSGAWISRARDIRFASLCYCSFLGFIAVFMVFFFFFVILLGLLSPLGETIVFEFVLMLFFSIVLVSNFNNVFTTFASFGWLLLIPSGVNIGLSYSVPL